MDVLGIKSMQADQDLKDMRGWGTFYCSAKWSLDKKIKNWLAFVLSQKKSKIKPFLFTFEGLYKHIKDLEKYFFKACISWTYSLGCSSFARRIQSRDLKESIRAVSIFNNNKDKRCHPW